MTMIQNTRPTQQRIDEEEACEGPGVAESVSVEGAKVRAAMKHE